MDTTIHGYEVTLEIDYPLDREILAQMLNELCARIESVANEPDLCVYTITTVL